MVDFSRLENLHFLDIAILLQWSFLRYIWLYQVLLQVTAPGRSSTEQQRRIPTQTSTTEQRRPSTEQRRLSTEQRRVLLPNGRDVTDSVHDLDPGTAVLLLLGDTAKLYAIWDGDRFSKMPDKDKGIRSNCKRD